ncbi:MAG: hypothetical protein AAFY72_08760 [Cyanobacteria bacterium J06649_4]
MSASHQDFDQHLPAEEADLKQFVDLPPSLPMLHQRHRPLLSQSRFNVGVDCSQPERELAGQVWQMWVVVGIAIALMLPVILFVVAEGDGWPLLLILPVFGLAIAGMVRSLRAEQAAAKKKAARRAKRLCDMRK